MTLEKAIRHLQKTGEETTRISAMDKESINTLINWINVQLDNPDPFTFKLYILSVFQGLRHFGLKVTDDIPLKEFHKTLGLPLDWHIQKFIDYNNEQNRLCAFESMKAPLSIEDTENLSKSGKAFGWDDTLFDLKVMFSEAKRICSDQ